VNHIFSGFLDHYETNAAVGLGNEQNECSVAIASHPILGYPAYHDLHEESTVCRLQMGAQRKLRIFHHCALYRVYAARPRLGEKPATPTGKTGDAS